MFQVGGSISEDPEPIMVPRGFPSVCVGPTDGLMGPDIEQRKPHMKRFIFSHWF